MNISELTELLSSCIPISSKRFSSDQDPMNTGTVTKNFDHFTQAAVLIPLVKRGNIINVVLTRRSLELKHHPGQIAFPGGKVKSERESHWLCAVREAKEEIGLNPKKVRKIAEIPAHRTITGFEVRAFIGEILSKNVFFAPDDKEVIEIFEVPLEFLLNKKNMVLHLRKFNGKERCYYAIPYGPYYIWGATARMIKSFCDLMDR